MENMVESLCSLEPGPGHFWTETPLRRTGNVCEGGGEGAESTCEGGTEGRELSWVGESGKDGVESVGAEKRVERVLGPVRKR